MVWKVKLKRQASFHEESAGPQVLLRQCDLSLIYSLSSLQGRSWPFQVPSFWFWAPVHVCNNMWSHQLHPQVTHHAVSIRCYKCFNGVSYHPDTFHFANSGFHLAPHIAVCTHFHPNLHFFANYSFHWPIGTPGYHHCQKVLEEFISFSSWWLGNVPQQSPFGLSLNHPTPPLFLKPQTYNTSSIT